MRKISDIVNSKDKIKDPYIIAEIGINHNGDLAIAKQLIDQAVDTGFDAVKFQKRTINIVYTKEQLDASRESPWGTTQRQQKEGLEFTRADYDELDRYCREKGIAWSASAWDLQSQEFLKKYDLPFNKVASAMTTYTPLLESIAEEGKYTFISTGMCTNEQISAAIAIFKAKNCPFTLMHTVSTYPAKVEVLNLLAIPEMKKTFNCDVGYSGHEIGVFPSELAVALGASVIERHITFDRSAYGSDQAASLEKKGCELMVRNCRLVHKILGDGVRKTLPEEMEVGKKLRWFEAAPQLSSKPAEKELRAS